MRNDVETKTEDTSPGDATAKTPPRGNAEGQRKSPLPPPDPKLNGTPKRGFGVFKRGPGAA